MKRFINLPKRAISFFMILVLCVSLLPGTVLAAGEAGSNDSITAYSTGKTIYTEFTGGSSNHSGDGSQSNPYNLFEDAYAAAQDGDVIYILGSWAFLNAADNNPFVISKSITIKGDNTVFSTRTAGIVLDADVTFDNVKLSFAHRYHDAIFANGHKLVLKNVTCESGSRKVDIFGGPLYMNGSIVGSNPGSAAEIVMSGGGENLGNIYAGAMNGAYNGSTTINLTDVAEMQYDTVYMDGAKETYVNLDNFLDVQEPAAPEAFGDYTVSGGVTVEIKNCDTKLVERVSSVNTSKAALIVDTAGVYNGLLTVKNVDEITVKGGGTFGPVALDECRIVLKESSSIDLSGIAEPKLVSIDSSDGTNNKLILGRTQTLDISDTITGTLIFETSYGYDGNSGTAEYGHTYLSINNASNAIVNFFPSLGQSDMTLDKGESEADAACIWKTSVNTGSGSLSISNLTITNPIITTTVSEISGQGDYYGKETQPFLTEIEWVETITDETWFYFEWIPVRYIVEYNEATYEAQVVDDGTFEAYIPELKLQFIHGSDSDNILSGYISPQVYMQNAEEGTNTELELPEPGTYKITIVPESGNKPIERKVTLIINEDVVTEGTDVTPVDTVTKISASTANDSVTMEENLQITGQITYNFETGNLSGTEIVPNGPVAVYINQKEYTQETLTTDSGSIDLVIAVTEENGFQLGENTIIVVYEGAEDKVNNYLARCSQTFTTVTVNPVSVKLQYDTINQQVAYTGLKAVCQTPVVNVVREDNAEVVLAANVIPEVFYKQGDTEIEPVLPGIYDVWFKVKGLEYDTIEEKAGTLTITAANPDIQFTVGTPVNGKVQLNATVNGSKTGSIPVGTIKFYQAGTECGEETLRFGEASLEVSNLEAGKTYIFKAEYVPDYSGNNFHYNSVNSEDVEVTISAVEDDNSGNTGNGGNAGDNAGGNSGTTEGNTSGGGAASSGGIGSSSSEANKGESSDKENSSDANENKDGTLSVSGTLKKGKSKVKVKLTREMMEQTLEKNNGLDTDITFEVLNPNGKVAYTLTVNTADMKAGSKLYVCEIDAETGEYILVNSKTYAVSKKGNVKLSMSEEKNYILLNEKAMNKVSDEIRQKVALKVKKFKVSPGEKVKIEFLENFNMENVKSISYKSNNEKVADVNKKGAIQAKKMGIAIIKVKVTLKNEEVKVLKVRMFVKK